MSLPAAALPVVGSVTEDQQAQEAPPSSPQPSSTDLVANNLKQRRWSRRLSWHKDTPTNDDLRQQRRTSNDPQNKPFHKQQYRALMAAVGPQQQPPTTIQRHHHHTNNWQLSSSRIIFVAFLTVVAGVLGFVGYHFLTQAEHDLTDAQFATISERALAEAKRIAQRKRYSIVTAAEMVGRMLPDANQWPFVHVNGFEEIGTNLLDTVSAQENSSILTFAPLVRLE